MFYVYSPTPSPDNREYSPLFTIVAAKDVSREIRLHLNDRNALLMT